MLPKPKPAMGDDERAEASPDDESAEGEPTMLAASDGDKLLGTGAAKRAADKIKGRKKTLDEKEQEATGGNA